MQLGFKAEVMGIGRHRQGRARGSWGWRSPAVVGRPMPYTHDGRSGGSEVWIRKVVGQGGGLEGG